MLLWVLWNVAMAGGLERPGSAETLRYAAELVELGRHEEAEALVRELLAEAQPLPGETPEARVQAAVEAADAGRRDVALATLRAVASAHAGSDAGMLASRLERELSVVGQRVVDVVPETWLRGEPLDWTGIRVVVFFETWCPHCARAMPRYSELQATWADRGLALLGVTRLSRSSEARLDSFLDGHALSVALDDGTLARRFAVDGVPAVAVVVDGIIRWRGHPKRLTDARLEALTTP